jgi:hypothetical protein
MNNKFSQNELRQTQGSRKGMRESAISNKQEAMAFERTNNSALKKIDVKLKNSI